MTVENTNLIEAGGRIVRARRVNNGNVIMTLLINDHRHIAQVPFIHYGLIDRSLMGNAKVLVKGHVYVSPTYDEILRRQNDRPAFLVDDIQIRKTQMEEAFGVHGRFCGTDYFMGKFTGTISSLVHTSNENWGEMFVDVDGYNGNTPSRVQFNYFLKGKLPSFDGFKEGDRVAILSSVHTTTKTIREEERTFVNLGVEDIVKINESAEAEPAPENRNETPRQENSRDRRRRKRRLVVMHNENRNNAAPEDSDKDLPTTEEINDGLMQVENEENKTVQSENVLTESVSREPVSAAVDTPAPESQPSPVIASDVAEQAKDVKDNSFVRNGYAEDVEEDTVPVSSDGEEQTTLYSDPNENPYDSASRSASPARTYYEDSDEDDDEDYDDSDFLSQFKK